MFQRGMRRALSLPTQVSTMIRRLPVSITKAWIEEMSCPASVAKSGLQPVLLPHHLRRELAEHVFRRAQALGLDDARDRDVADPPLRNAARHGHASGCTTPRSIRKLLSSRSLTRSACDSATSTEMRSRFRSGQHLAETPHQRRRQPLERLVQNEQAPARPSARAPARPSSAGRRTALWRRGLAYRRFPA